MHVSWKAHESKKKRLERTLPQDHEDHIEVKGQHVSLQLGAQVYSDASIDENSGGRSSSGEGEGEDRKIASMATGQSEEQKRGNSGSTEREKNKTVPVATLIDTNGQAHGQALMIQWFLLIGVCTDMHLLASCGKDRERTFLWKMDGTVPCWESLFFHLKLVNSDRYPYDDIKIDGRPAIIWLRCGRDDAKC